MCSGALQSCHRDLDGACCLAVQHEPESCGCCLPMILYSHDYWPDLGVLVNAPASNSIQRVKILHMKFIVFSSLTPFSRRLIGGINVLRGGAGQAPHWDETQSDEASEYRCRW